MVRNYKNRCEQVQKETGEPVMIGVNRYNCPNICSINSSDGVNIDSSKLSWYSLNTPDYDMQKKGGISYFRAYGLNATNDFYPPGVTNYMSEVDLDTDDIINKEWGDDLCFFVDDEPENCWRYYNSETGELCTESPSGIHSFGMGSSCSSAARDYGGFNDSINIGAGGPWISHCEDLPECKSIVTDCRDVNSGCLSSYRWDSNGYPNTCYSTNEGVCVDFNTFDDESNRVPWCWSNDLIPLPPPTTNQPAIGD